MSGNRLALVADDERLGSALQAYLSKHLAQPIFQCKYDAIRPHLGRDTDGFLLLVLSRQAEVEQVRWLVQEICLQKLPPVILIAEHAELPPSDETAFLDPYIAKRLRWPDEAEELLDILDDGVAGSGQGFAGTGKESLRETISNHLLYQTPSLLHFTDRIALAAAHDVTVLLTGETGSGKTYLARLMHDCSPRSQHPFINISCGAQPPNLIESAFFGHVRGAFTGADRPRIGKFAAAGQGTILLDEIDTLGLEQQASLLRVIETGEYELVGCNETQRCSARIIVASNWDLESAVQRGKFRQDLYYRLNVLSFHLAPLRQRVRDIAPLVRGLAARFTTKFRKDLFDISPEAMACLEAFPWPGNIRQLANIVQQAVLVSDGNELLAEHLPSDVRDYVPPANSEGPQDSDSLMHNRQVVERNVIERALTNNGFSRARTASALGISRVTLYKKMKRYGLMHVTPLRSPSA